MNLYKYDTNEHVNRGKAVTSFSEVEVGGKYIMADHDFEGYVRNGKETVLLYERSNQNGIVFVTKYRGEQPFSPFTNDSIRDGLDSDTLSKVILREGYKVYVVLHNDSDTSVKDMYIMNIDAIDCLDACITVTVEFKGDTLTAPKDAALEHISKAMKQRDIKIQLRDKYCFQSARIVFNCMMINNGNEKLLTERDDKKYELNSNSYDRRDIISGEVYPFGFYRVYHSKRMSGSPLIYVEGVRIPMEYFSIDIKEYIKTLDYAGIADNIRVLTLLDGTKVYGIINNRGEVRIIMNVGFFTTFPLSDYEVKEGIINIEPLAASPAKKLSAM